MSRYRRTPGDEDALVELLEQWCFERRVPIRRTTIVRFAFEWEDEDDEDKYLTPHAWLKHLCRFAAVNDDDDD